MLRLTETGFGYVVVDGKRYSYDIVIYPDGRVDKRLKSLSEKYRDEYGHTPLSGDELKHYLSKVGKIDALVIGTGQFGVLPLTSDANRIINELRDKGLEVYIDLTPKVLDIYNRLIGEGKKVLAIIHVTC